MVSRTEYSSIKSWISLEDKGLLAKKYHGYDSQSRVTKECLTRIDTFPGGQCLIRDFTYTTDGIPGGGTPYLGEWLQIFEDNQSATRNIMTINSLLQSTASSLVAGFDYDSISFAYPTAVQEIITYSKTGSSVRVITVNYLSAAKTDISSVGIV